MNKINIGNINVGSAKLGTSDVTIYLGTELVYSSHNYEAQYLTFTALEDGTFKFSVNSIQYSLDSGTTWSTLASNTNSPTVESGHTIMWKASGLTTSSNNGIGTFSSTGAFNVEGNVMSLHFGDNFSGQTSLSGINDSFRNLFSGCTRLASAENLSLPATTLAQGCYHAMFRGCTSITAAPQLPATTLSYGCYMNMFRDCINLTAAPSLPATTLATWCYRYMFSNCTSLTTAPQLPATTLAQECYSYMFVNCTSLTTAPILLAESLANSSYRQMFSGCTSLNSITCLATDTSASNCTTNWVDGVASAGTFTKNASMSGWTTSVSGIPSGWTVEDYPTKERTTSGTPYCSGSTADLYVDVYSQISYNDGVTWYTTATTPTVVEERCAECGFVSRDVSGTSYCSGNSLVVDVDHQESYDSGSTWQTVSSSITTVERCSSTCGCVGCVEKFCGTDTNGDDFVILADGNGILSSTSFPSDSVVSGMVGDATTELGEYCFQPISNSLSALTIGDTVTTIKHEAFMQTELLTTLTIPSSVTQIDFWAFTRCYGLTEVIFEGAPPTLDWGAPFHDFYPPVIYVPDAYYSAYVSLGSLFCDASGYDASTIIQPISNKS